MNPVDQHIKHFFHQAGFFQWRQHHVSFFIKNYAKQYKPTRMFEKSILANAPTVRDLTRKGNDCFKYPNLHFTNSDFNLNYNNLDEQTSEAEFFINSTILCQIFENFERFMVDALTEHYLVNQTDQISHKLTEFAILERSTLREQIKKFGSKDNKRKYLWVVRKISNIYKEAEISNYRDLVYNDWFDIFSTFRHKATHEGRVVQNSIVEKYHGKKLEIFHKYFPSKTLSGKQNLINVEKTIFDLNVSAVVDLSFLIYKSISIKNNWDWEILEKLDA